MKTPPYALGSTTFGVQGRPVMIGSLFYKGDKKVKDHRNGEVDCQRLEKEMKAICILGRKVGLDRAVDIIAETPCAMENYVNFLADMTDDALLIGGLNEETRIAGYRRAKDLGITGRCGVNSVSTCTTDEELAVMKETGIRFAILQTLDPSAVYPEEKIRLLKEELLGKCVQGGIEGAAVDVGILDFTSAHLAVESIKM
ncbi:MAG: hypothetical protein LUP94_02360, partial [Candidatus Methanomethylicus sp.]|nr:hypothetical protein [Candidatus Methanomethylicus sp.]